jgi:hypothetical protein
MKKMSLLLAMLFFATFTFAQEHTITYQVIVHNPFDGSTATIVGGSFQTGSSFTLPEFTLPGAISGYQQLYDAIEGTEFAIESGALSENITIGINIFQFDPNNSGFYFNDDLFMFLGITVIGESSGMHGLDEFYYFNEGKHATLTIPISGAFNTLLQILNLGLNDIGFGYYIGSLFYSSGLSFQVTSTDVILQLSHFSKFGGGRGSLVGLNEGNEKPLQFSLSQNYPNPFNPTTRINFTIPEAGFVTLKIYDAIGSEVKTLVSKNLSVGFHEVQFDAKKITSGIYFYELRTKNQTITKKMILMK